jgi:carboxyl-terminal processing protease
MKTVARLQMPIWLVLPVLCLTLIVGVGMGVAGQRWLAPSGDCPQASATCAEFAKFWQVWDLAQSNFVDPKALSSEQMTAGAINGMLDSLGDQGHTRYLTAAEAKRWGESLSGSFEGIGAYISVRDGKPMVASPVEGSPAEKAGIRAGDFILKVNDTDVTSMTSTDVVSLVRGPSGSSVRLTLRHADADTPYELTVVRAKIEVPSVSWKMLPDNVALVRLTQFARRSGDELATALKQARAGGAKAIVFDMRDNGGGLVNEALSVAGEFLPADSTVLLEEDRTGKRVPLKATGDGAARDLPMVVLVNGNTASSAEIVAGALQDAGRARLIGESTIGTGTVLTPYNIQGGGQLLLGTVQWLTPDGRLIRQQGVTPDVKVSLGPGDQALTPAEAAALSAQALKESKDVQLVRALELLGGAAQN